MSKEQLSNISDCLADVKDKQEFQADDHAQHPQDQFVSTLWCLKNTVTGIAIQMPVPGAVVFFPSVDDAREFHRLVARGIGRWTPRRVTRQEYKDFSSYSFWSTDDPFSYITIQVKYDSPDVTD